MTRANVFILFLYSSRNIAGCIFGLLGLAAYFGGFINQWWFPICVALYAAGVLMVPSRELIDVELFRHYDGQQLAAGVEQLISQTGSKLPAEALQILESIPGVLQSLVPRLTGQDNTPMLPPEQLHTVVAAITRDLPQTVAGYLRLPPAFANLHPLEGGKTAKDLLQEQLKLLKNQLDKIAEAAFRDDADALLINGKYLKEKFHAPSYLN